MTKTIITIIVIFVMFWFLLSIGSDIADQAVKLNLNRNY